MKLALPILLLAPWERNGMDPPLGFWETPQKSIYSGNKLQAVFILARIV